MKVMGDFLSELLGSIELKFKLVKKIFDSFFNVLYAKQKLSKTQ